MAERAYGVLAEFESPEALIAQSKRPGRRGTEASTRSPRFPLKGLLRPCAFLHQTSAVSG